MNELYAGDIVLFYDHEVPPESPEPGPNQVAIIVDERGAFFVRRGRVHCIPPDRISTLPELQLRRGAYSEFRNSIESYFSGALKRPAHFRAGLAALLYGNMQLFIEGRLFPIKPSHQNEQQYELAWQNFKSKLMPMDAIFTRSFKNPVSNFIAVVTHGPWSHMAMHVSDGDIAESTVPRMRRGPIELYKGKYNWVAAYPHVEAEDNQVSAARAREIADASFGKFRDGYNFRDAIRHGWRAFRGNHEHSLVPNSQIYNGIWKLVAHV